MVKIRHATTADITGIEDVVQAVWNDETVLPEVAEAQIEHPDASLWVADDDGQIAGFVSGFLTTSYEGEKRWDVDLIAVRPSDQSEGLGRSLIATIWIDAQAHEAAYARALVRNDNLASQRAFSLAGFETDRRSLRLYVWSPWEYGEPGMQLPFGVSLLPVDTLTYRGLWIEGFDPAMVSPDEQRAVISAARAQVAEEDRFNTSALIPARTERRLADDLRSMAIVKGTYHWWRKTD
jgi:ribosomal protein S18 acetylase RimI-like enzyme